ASAWAQSSYSDPQGRFHVRVPAGWSAGAQGPDAVVLNSGPVYVTVMAWQRGDAAGVMAEVASQIRGQWRGFTEAAHGESRLSGLPGLYVTYAGVPPKSADSYLICTAAGRDGVTYMLMAQVP